MSHSADGVRNGHIQIHVSSDLMKAELDLFPPATGGFGFTVLSVSAELESAGVSFGINKELLEKKILESLENDKVLRGIPVALGLKPVKEVPSYWHLKKRLLNSPQVDLDAMNVDYRENSPYVLVKKGEPLAKMIPASPGVPGKSIAGEVLPATPKEVVLLKPGEYTIEKESVLYAARHGRFEIREKMMSVNETLDIAGNVDYSTGHIAFPGDVIIHGAVCDGFQVASGKSIFVKQTMDATKVLSRGDLVVEGGIKGRGNALVRVDGRIAAKFIENARVESYGDIVIEKAVMHSDMYSLNHIDLGEAGVIVGGELWARNGLRAGKIGRPESPAASLRVGIDYTVERKIRSSNEQIDRLEAKLDKLRTKVGLNKAKQELISQVEGVLAKLEQNRTEFVGMQFKNRHAKVIVFGEVGEGTEIHIAELTLRVGTAVEGVVFYYDTEGPRIATRNIVDSDKNPFKEIPEDSETPDQNKDRDSSEDSTEETSETTEQTEQTDNPKPTDDTGKEQATDSD